MLSQEKDQELRQRIANGFVVESEDDMSPTFKKCLEVILTVQGDTELVSAAASSTNSPSNSILRTSAGCLTKR